MYSFFGLTYNKKTRNQNKNQNKIKNNKTRKINKMNCSPAVEGKTVASSSCLTPEILYKIKHAYNNDHLTDQITTTNPYEIWNELKNRLTLCNKEECWLKQIDDIEVRENIYAHIFAPKQPPEWKEDKNAWLTNFDIMDVLEQYEDKYRNFKLIGTTFIDFDSKMKRVDRCVEEELCKFSLREHINNKITKIGIVFNLDKHTQGGSHWVSMFIDIKEQIIFYFDSAANKTPIEMQRLVKRIMDQGKKLKKPIYFKYYENYPLEHQMGNTECGMYSLFFTITMITGKTDDVKFKNTQEKIDFFKKHRIPDKYVEELRSRYFNP
jgi:hypothetical protein